MTVRYLVDTNIILEPLKVPANPVVLAQLYEHQDELALAATVWHELWSGCYRLAPSRRRSELEYYLNNIVANTIPILPFDAIAADWLAAERARLSIQGRPPTLANGQIAAVAAVNQLTLVTRNVADFTHYQGLTVESWFDPTP
jgi:tRNA(fMet)-specific endonuclease VapC